MDIANGWIGYQNLLDREKQLVIASNLSLAGKSLTYRSLLFNNDPPFTLIAILGEAVSISNCANIIGLTAICDRQFPTPILLMRFASLNSFFPQLVPKPSGQILPEATRIDKMRAHFREIESAGPENNVKGIHGFADR